MASINEIREKYPQYNDMSDEDFAGAFHKKYYSDIPKNDFYKKIGFNHKEENLLQKIMRYGIKDPLAGALNLAKEVGNVPHKLAPSIFPAQPDYDWSKELGVKEPNTADKLIQGLTQYGPSFAIPGANIGRVSKAIESIPKIGKYASRAISEAIPQALFSASQAPEGSMIESGAKAGATIAPFAALSELMKTTNPTTRMIAKGLSGAGGALLGRESAKQAGFGELGSDLAGVVGAALGSRGFNTEKEMKRNLTEGVHPTVAEHRLRAAKRLGLDYLTPAEAGVSSWAARRQGSLGRTEEGAKLLSEKGIKRQESERNAIEKTLNKIYSPDMEPKIKEAYEKIRTVKLPSDFIEKYSDNEIIKRAQKVIENKPAYKEELKNTPRDSLVYWDHVKRSMDDMVNTAERKGEYNEARIISNSRADMRDQMDAHFPEYAQARAMYELKKTREGLEKAFDQKEINGTNFYRALASQKKFDEIIGHLKNAPEAADNLRDMRFLFKDLMGPPTIKTAKGTEERGMNQSRSSGAFLENLMEHVFTKGKNDKAAIEFITSKDWNKQLKEINKISDKQLKLAAFSLALSRGVSQYAGTSD